MRIKLSRLLGLTLLLLAVPVVAQSPDLPPVPAGIEVQARGPVHEAFATPTAEHCETPLVPQRPPAPIEEMPPAEKPDGSVIWIGGYWAYDDERHDYLWVSGCWRAIPPGRSWVPGYWREHGEKWQWVPGFWTASDKAANVVYQPEPPAPPQVAPPGPAPDAESFYVPGHWVWHDGRYQWQAGYWARMQPGYVWIPGHYRWTPYGYVYVAGYWDIALPRRGMLYAPVVVDHTVVGATFVYTPAYAVSDVVVVDTLWVRPACCHYYFGDYYGPVYRRYGYESCIVYSERHYDSIIVYRSWECRNEPRWRERQMAIYVERDAGRAPLPPRTLVQQNITINNTHVTNNITVVAPATKVAADRGIKTVTLPPESRVQARAAAKAVVMPRTVDAKGGPAGKGPGGVGFQQTGHDSTVSPKGGPPTLQKGTPPPAKKSQPPGKQDEKDKKKQQTNGNGPP
jgi:hypothetical protein